MESDSVRNYNIHSKYPFRNIAILSAVLYIMRCWRRMHGKSHIQAHLVARGRYVVLSLLYAATATLVC